MIFTKIVILSRKITKIIINIKVVLFKITNPDSLRVKMA